MSLNEFSEIKEDNLKSDVIQIRYVIQELKGIQLGLEYKDDSSLSSRLYTLTNTLEVKLKRLIRMCEAIEETKYKGIRK